MPDIRRLSSFPEQPYGRRFGKVHALEPLDYREGFPGNGVELVGAIGLDDEGYPLDAKKEQLASAKATAARQAAARPTSGNDKANAKVARPTQQSGTAPAPNPAASKPPNAALFSLDGAKKAIPYVAVAVVVVVIVSHFAMKG